MKAGIHMEFCSWCRWTAVWIPRWRTHYGVSRNAIQGVTFDDMGISKCQASLWLSDHSRVSVSMNENDKSKLLNLNFHIVRFFQVDQIPILSKHFHGTFRYSKLLCLIRSTDRADRTLDWRPKKFEIYDKSLHCLSLC